MAGLGLVLLVAAVAVMAYLHLFSLFMLYDDEGYVLISLNNFVADGGLYDRVYSQYGPLFYLVLGGVAKMIGFEWTHDLGRLLTWGNWMLTAGACGWIAGRLSGSRLAGATAFAAVGGFLTQMAFETIHPGNSIAALLAIGSATSVECLLRNRPGGFALTVVLLATATGLIKINVGCFVLAAGGCWCWLHADLPAKLQRLRFAPLLAGLLLPALLMSRYAGQDWGRTYIFTATVLICTVTALAWRDRTTSLSWRALTWAGVAGVAVVGLVVGLTVLTGSSLAGTLIGILIGPLQHPDAYHFAFNWRPGTWVATGATAFAATTLLLRFGTKPPPPVMERSIAAVRLGMALLFLWWALPQPPRAIGGVFTLMAASTIWWCWPLREPTSAAASARRWLGVLLAWQFLHAYPVAGTQLTWAGFLWIPLAVVGLFELRPAGAHAIKWRTAGRWGAGLASAALVAAPLSLGAYFYRHAEPLNLPGVQLLRVPPSNASALRIITRNAALHADMLHSLPGTWSFNAWSGVRSPTAQNTTHWFRLLSPPEKAEIAAALKNARNPAVITQPALVQEIVAGDGLREDTLLTHSRRDYAPLFTCGPFEFNLRPQETNRVVLDSAELFQRTNTSGVPGAPALIKLTTLLPREVMVARVEVAWFDGDLVRHDAEADWHAGNTRVQGLRLTPEGGVVGSADVRELAWPLSAPQLTQWWFYPETPLPTGVPLDQLWLRLISPAGERVGEARFVDRP